MKPFTVIEKFRASIAVEVADQYGDFVDCAGGITLYNHAEDGKILPRRDLNFTAWRIWRFWSGVIPYLSDEE